MFDDIIWKDAPPALMLLSLGETQPKPQTGRPPGTGSTKPYWEYVWQLTHDSGIRITNLVARDTQSPGSTEAVAETIDFTDFKVVFDNTPQGQFEDFDVAAAFSHPDSNFQFCRNGTRHNVDPNDDLFQYGLLLTLAHDFGGTCSVTLSISVVLRGAAHDFDPGGVPWALEVFPQISYKWEPLGSSGRRVNQFRGSVRVAVNNKLFSMQGTVMPSPNENVVSFFSDSNISKSDEYRASIMGKGSTADTSIIPAPALVVAAWETSNPFGWGILFDYNRLNVTTEQEYLSVYGPKDLTFSNTTRSALYYWPSGKPTGGGLTVGENNYKVEKAPRQGYYDNIHIHAKMPDNDSRGNLQVHAPFCGHSCVHMHWRWSDVSSAGAAGGRGWQYKGWSSGATPTAFSQEKAPLIPPNQRLSVALCQVGRTRFSDGNILDSANLGKLDPLRKMIWYCSDIFHTQDAPINAGEKQVIMEHGFGWAYHYSSRLESWAVFFLAFSLNNNLPVDPRTETQSDLMKFFEDKVYPGFRYWAADGIVVNQVPEGDFKDTMVGSAKTMESL